MASPEQILMMLNAQLATSPYLSYVGLFQYGLLPVPDRSREFVVRLCPSDVLTDPETWPEEAKFVVIIYGSHYCPLAERAWHWADANTVLDLFEHIRLALHADPTIGGTCVGCFVSSGKFDIKKHSWGAKERLDAHPLYMVEVYVTMRYETDLPV